MTGDFESNMDVILAGLRKELGSNLYSCCLYGSAVRGDLIKGVSDLNLLIVLNQSTAAAHTSISRVLAAHPKVAPFILGRRGFNRSVRSFAPKFISIKRNYRVVYGEDPLADIQIDPQLERFLCEQALRNLRLRLVHAYVTRSGKRDYGVFVIHTVTPLFLRLSELLRLSGRDLPIAIADRIPFLQSDLKLDGRVLQELVSLKASPKKLTDEEAVALHGRLFPLVDQALRWVEENWPQQ